MEPGRTGSKNAREVLLENGARAPSQQSLGPGARLASAASATSGGSILSGDSLIAQNLDRLLSGEPNEASQQGSNMLFIAVICCCFSPILFGYTVAYTSPTQGTMEGDAIDGVFPPPGLIVMSSDTFSWYAALLNIGCVLGAFSGSVLSDRLGRKKTLLLTMVPHLVGWIGSAFVSNVALLIILRMIIGWGVGVGSAVTPVYIGEVATTGLRGGLGAANQLSVTFGIFFVNFAGSYVFIAENGSEDFVQWRQICLMGAACTLLLGTVAFLPESPKWLAGQGRAEDAKAALARLRNGDCSSEAAGILAEAAHSQQACGAVPGAAGASLRQYKPSLVIGIGLCTFQQLGGVNAVMMYTGQIIAEAGVKDSNTAAMFVMGMQVVLTGISCLLMERLGRRALLLFGTSCMTFAHLALSYYFLSQARGMWGPSWLALGALGIFILGFSLAMGPIPWLILAEIFPTEVRSVACSLATAINWSASFIVVLAFIPLQKAISKEGTFFLFTIICGLCFAFVLKLVPETKGKTVEEVLELLRGEPVSPRVVSLQPARGARVEVTVQ